MRIFNVTRGELTAEEKTAINILANIECSELDCEFCPLNVRGEKCLAVTAKKMKIKEEW